MRELLEDFGSTRWSHVRSMVGHALPGMVLPALVYFSLRPHLSVLVALTAASCVPLLDSAVRLLRGRAPNVVGLLFIPFTAGAVALAAVLHSPVFLLAKGGVVSALTGLAFAGSAVIGRPLCRTLAVHMSSDRRDGRHRLAERWGHPTATAVFRILSVGWGILLLLLGGQQILLAVATSPGVVMALEPPVKAVITALGIVASVLYVRRMQAAHPELAMLPARARSEA